MHIPIILTFFANPHNDLNLTEEQKGIQGALRDLDGANKIDYKLCQNTDIKDYFDYLRIWGNRVVICHYAGHADSEGLSLQNAHTNFGSLAKEMVDRNKDSLILVFLNGCSTKKHVETLFELGVPAVIASSVSIDDTLAKQFAIQFYENLAKGDDIETAYMSASNFAEGLRNEKRFQNLGKIKRWAEATGAENESDEFPWGLYVKEENYLVGKNLQSIGEKLTNYLPNQHLVKVLIRALANYKEGVKKFLDKANASDADWENKTNLTSTATKLIAYSFVGHIGIILQNLETIVQEKTHETEPAKYIKACFETAKRTVQMLCFALISKLWDVAKQAPVALPEATQTALKSFFEGIDQPTLASYGQLLKALYLGFEHQKIAFPLEELKDWAENIQEKSVFLEACGDLQALQNTAQKEKNVHALCHKAEVHLATILERLAFLATYKMVSIKKIEYDEVRNVPPHYLHEYTPIGLDKNFEVSMLAENVTYTTKTVQNASILLFKTDYVDSINLFPFLIDMNALMQVNGVDICAYGCRNILDEQKLNYYFLKNNEAKSINFEDIGKEGTNLNDILKLPENRIKIKLDRVFLKIEEAQNTILPATATPKNEVPISLNDFLD